jgi:hypothetical protein
MAAQSDYAVMSASVNTSSPADQQRSKVPVLVGPAIPRPQIGRRAVRRTEVVVVQSGANAEKKKVRRAVIAHLTFVVP